MIKINNYYTILGRDLNYIIECSNENKDLGADEVEKVSSKRNKYFSSIESVCSFVAKQDNIEESIIDEFQALKEKVTLIYQNFEGMEVDKSRKIKIDIAGMWFIIGTDSCYRIIKKEYIKESRFTKEENIGKDKFITCGFAPNVYISLKIILGEILLEFLGKEENCTINDLEECIDKAVSDIKNMTILDADDSEIIEDEEEVSDSNE